MNDEERSGPQSPDPRAAPQQPPASAPWPPAPVQWPSPQPARPPSREVWSIGAAYRQLDQDAQFGNPFGWQAPSQPDRPQVPPSDRSGGRLRIGPLILATAVLSAALSAGGTYAVLSLVPNASDTNPATSSSSGSAPAAQVLSLTTSDAIVRAVGLVKPSVVTIETTGTAGFGRRSAEFTGSGSGFIVSADGLIVTNNHVVAGAQTLTVVLDDSRQLDGTVVKSDAAHDLAVIKVDAGGLTPVNLGDSANVQVGELAIAIGSPLGEFTDSATSGIVSGLNRSITVGDSGSNFTEDLSGLIQTDAAINPGSSGGPLLDAGGSVIGVVTASSSTAQDIGFAIPVNQVKQLLAATRAQGS
jgi:S1-C subfamily serine protease